MRRVIFIIAALVPTAALADPVYLSCSYVAAPFPRGSGQTLHKSIVLDEANGTAVWTDEDAPNPQPRILKALFQPNVVDVEVFPKPTESHVFINRTTLSSHFVLGGGLVGDWPGQCELLQRPSEKKF